MLEDGLRVATFLVVIAILADGIAAVLVAWDHVKYIRENLDARYLFILFASMALARVLRLASILTTTGSPSRMDRWKAFVYLLVESIGLWSFYLYQLGKFNGRLQDKAARRLARLWKAVHRGFEWVRKK